MEWRADGSAVATWKDTKRGAATLIVREIPSAGMRYFVRTEAPSGRTPVQHLAIKGSDNLQNFKDDVDYAKVGSFPPFSPASVWVGVGLPPRPRGSVRVDAR